MPLPRSDSRLYLGHEVLPSAATVRHFMCVLVKIALWISRRKIGVELVRSASFYVVSPRQVFVRVFQHGYGIL